MRPAFPGDEPNYRPFGRRALVNNFGCLNTFFVFKATLCSTRDVHEILTRRPLPVI
jgi:hypothetical protein